MMSDRLFCIHPRQDDPVRVCPSKFVHVSDMVEEYHYSNYQCQHCGFLLSIATSLEVPIKDVQLCLPL
jgi:hypothetical protein